MKLLVTGGAGFIGSNFIRMILAEEPEVDVVNFDDLTYAGNLENLADVSESDRYHFVKGNICDTPLILKTLKKYNITHIINFAAESHVDRSIKAPDIFVETNIKGTLSLLNAIREYRIERYLQVSTDEVYGSLSFSDLPFNEKTPLSPRSPYSSSKCGADVLVQAYFHTYNLPVLITRCSNNYGPYQFPEKLIPLMINNIRKGKHLPVYGDGRNVRDWIHVSDHNRGIWSALNKGKMGDVYNFGGNAEIANIDLVKLLIREMEAEERLISYVPDRLGHDLRYAMDFTKAKADLGWEPKYNFEQGIKETIEWYTANVEWCERIFSGDYLKMNKKYS